MTRDGFMRWLEYYLENAPTKDIDTIEQMYKSINNDPFCYPSTVKLNRESYNVVTSTGIGAYTYSCTDGVITGTSNEA